jgi:chromosome segregation ATPase
VALIQGHWDVKRQGEVTALQDEMNRLTTEQDMLQMGQAQIESGLQELRKEKEDLQRHLEWLLDQKQELDTWLAQNPPGELDPDRVVVPTDVPSQQLLDKEAEAAAIEDTIYFLRKAYERTAGDPRMNATEADTALSSYLFEVRKLAKQQFMALALKQKIAQRRGQTGL